MGHTFTYYAFLIKLTKSREKSNIKLSPPGLLAGTKKRDIRITVQWIIPYSSSKSLEHNFPFTHWLILSTLHAPLSRHGRLAHGDQKIFAKLTMRRCLELCQAFYTLA